jgi:putative FmdB family regulatory protein
MPLYEYRCPACDRRFELLQAVGAGSEDAVCPACGAAPAERQLSTFAVNQPASGGGARSAESFGCGLPQCGGGACGGGGDWN